VGVRLTARPMSRVRALASVRAGDADAPERARLKFPTAAIAVPEFTGTWQELGPERARQRATCVRKAPAPAGAIVFGCNRWRRRHTHTDVAAVRARRLGMILLKGVAGSRRCGHRAWPIHGDGTGVEPPARWGAAAAKRLRPAQSESDLSACGRHLRYAAGAHAGLLHDCGPHPKLRPAGQRGLLPLPGQAGTVVEWSHAIWPYP
jgi:hypothetical protein